MTGLFHLAWCPPGSLSVAYERNSFFLRVNNNYSTLCMYKHTHTQLSLVSMGHWFEDSFPPSMDVQVPLVYDQKLIESMDMESMATED